MSDHDNEIEVEPPEQVPTRRPRRRTAAALRVALRRAHRRSAAPITTTIIAFLMGGLVVALHRQEPVEGLPGGLQRAPGINWFFHVGNHHARIPFSTHKMWFPWDTASIAAGNLQQTLLLTTPIILTALALAFAFRCGLFNIGGQGQYIAGTIFAVWLGSSFVHMNPFLHVMLCLVVGTLAGAAWAGSPASSRRPSARTR